MSSEWWKKVEETYHKARELRGEERSRFLDEACDADMAMRTRLEALLQQDENSDSFLNRPAVELAARWSQPAERSGLLPGSHIGSYEVLEPIGAGGMGEVYSARDLRLGRKVAIKILPAEFSRDSDRLRRFEREARTASASNHPNIITIYEIGEDQGRRFIVQEFIEGQTLRQRMMESPLALAEALDVATQVGGALAAAHAAGVIHRDIKPENIMVRPDGYAKVLDFGLAKLTDAELGAARETAHSTLRTETGMLMGTARYMSPEQARGLNMDERTDIFSFGVVLYEMVAGHGPFEGATTADVLTAILHKEPPPLAGRVARLPAGLEEIVAKALSKDREKRYPFVKDMLLDLKTIKREVDSGVSSPRSAAGADVTLPRSIGRRRLVAMAIVLVFLATLSAFLYWSAIGRDEAIDSLAVLPFVNVGGSSDTEYLSDGISDSVINSLTQLSNLKVISLSSVLRYKGQQVNPEVIGRELNVRAVLMGRLIQRGNELTISTELVDVRDHRRIWGEQYNRNLADIVQLQADISREISERLRLELTAEDRAQLVRSYTKNSEAYQLYLQGRFHWNKFTETGFRKSIEYFDRALEKDPNYALAYAGIADSYIQLGVDFAATDSVPNARKYAARALGLDDRLAQAHVSLGTVKLFYDWDFPAAEREYKRAIDLNPGDPDARHFYGHYLEAVGRLDEAILETSRGVQLDPNSLIINTELVAAYYLARRYDEAIEQCLKTLDLDPSFGFARQVLGKAYIQKGRHEEAIAELRRAMDTPGGVPPDMLMELGRAYAVSGKRNEALKTIEELKRQVTQSGADSFLLAPIYVALGEKDQALAWLEKAYVEKSFWMIFLGVEPAFDDLRSDPRFTDLVRRIGLP